MLGVSVQRNDREISAKATLEVSEDWKVRPIKEPMRQNHFIIITSKVKDFNTIGVRVSLPDGERLAKFVILSPDDRSMDQISTKGEIRSSSYS